MSDGIDRLYKEAQAVRAEIDALWNDAQVTDVLSKGAASAAQRQSLTDAKRGAAVSIALQNARKWRRLAALSEKLGGLIDQIDRVKAAPGAPEEDVDFR